MRKAFCYPSTMTTVAEEGIIIARFPDLPEALTFGNDKADACAQAADCLDEAIAGRIKRRDDIPEPSAKRAGQINIAVPPLMAAKAAVYLAMRDAKVSNVALARKLGVDERQVRWMLDPKRATRLPQIERALAVLGKGVEIRLFDLPGANIAATVAAKLRARKRAPKRAAERKALPPTSEPVRRRA